MKIIVHCYQYSTLTAKADVTIVFKKYWNRLVRSKESKFVNVMCTFELDTAPTFCHKEFEYKFYLWAQISTPQIKSVHFSLWTTSQTSNASSHSFNKMSPTRWSHFSTRCGTQHLFSLPISQTVLLFLHCQQMAMLGFFLPPYAAAWLEPTSVVELHQMRLDHHQVADDSLLRIAWAKKLFWWAMSHFSSGISTAI